MKKQKIITIILKNIDPPSFFIWKWKKIDYDKSVKIVVDKKETYFKYEFPSFYEKRKELPDMDIPLHGLIKIVIKDPSQDFLDGIENPSGSNGIEVAKEIYSLYEKILEKITFYGRWIVKLSNLTDSMKTSFSDLFYDNTLSIKGSVLWSTNNRDWKIFKIEKKGRFSKNPMFKSVNLLTPKKWDKINTFASTNMEIDKEIEELVKIKNKALWGNKRIPVVETAALIEVTIRNKLQIILKNKGQSKTKIHDNNDETTLSILLNVILPLIFTKSEIKKYKKYIDNLDALRKIRNDIMHRNISEKEIDIEKVKKGIDAAIKITQLLNSKINTN